MATNSLLEKRLPAKVVVAVLLACLAGGLALLWVLSTPALDPTPVAPPRGEQRAPKPRRSLNDSGFILVSESLEPWKDPTSFADIRAAFHRAGYRKLPDLDRRLAEGGLGSKELLAAYLTRGLLYMYEGEPERGYEEWTHARGVVAADPGLAHEWLSTLIFLQGVAALRRGETDNCVHCRGEGACIFPILPQAVHTKPEGSRLAAQHFTEYLRRHPEDRGVQWLLNVAHMTLGEHPDRVPPAFLLPLERFRSEPEHSIGKFRDVAHLVGVNRFNQAGGAIMEDFDNDGLLDLVVSSTDPAMPLAFYRNKGDGTFEERAEKAGLRDQLGGLYCVQTDYNNDGWMDVFVIRGAWFTTPMRPSLLRNNGDGTFTDITQQAGLMHPVNAIVACWADFDNDGHLDLFIGCDNSPNRLYRNKGDGTFEEVAAPAGVAGNGKCCRGASWGDFDGDGHPDLFINYLNGPPQLLRNNRNGTFTDVAAAMGVVAPTVGFSCWFWDYDNDGWLDLYATSYERSLNDIVRGMLGEPQKRQTDRLYRNLGGKRFEDVSRAAGVEFVMSSMGSNFADFDNDGFLDYYLGTGEPAYSTLVPNRLFRNVGGKRFADITFPSRTGHLQKGHGVACGDWDRDGHVDLFVQIGGANPGDAFHNALFQNPGGHGNSWLNVKLVGKRTNRAAIGARIKAVTAGPAPQTVYRHVNSGSSFGANPLEQLVGLGKASRVAVLEVYWPTSGTTQVFRDVAVNQAIEVTEFAPAYRTLHHKRVPLPPAPKENSRPSQLTGKS